MYLIEVKLMLQTREASSVQRYQEDKDTKGGNGSQDQAEWNLIKEQDTKKDISFIQQNIFCLGFWCLLLNHT